MIDVVYNGIGDLEALPGFGLLLYYFRFGIDILLAFTEGGLYVRTKKDSVCSTAVRSVTNDNRGGIGRYYVIARIDPGRNLSTNGWHPIVFLPTRSAPDLVG